MVKVLNKNLKNTSLSKKDYLKLLEIYQKIGEILNIPKKSKKNYLLKLYTEFGKT
jgi:hypothetical protein